MPERIFAGYEVGIFSPVLQQERDQKNPPKRDRIRDVIFRPFAADPPSIHFSSWTWQRAADGFMISVTGAALARQVLLSLFSGAHEARNLLRHLYLPKSVNEAVAWQGGQDMTW